VGAKPIGIIDRDFRTDKFFGELESDQVYLLPVHEVESFLCEPELLSALIYKSGGILVSPDKLRSLTRTFCLDMFWNVVANRVAQAAKAHFNISIPKSLLSSVSTQERLCDLLLLSAASERRRFDEHFKKASIWRWVKEEVSVLKAAMDSSENTDILKLFPGKELFRYLTRNTGLSSAEQAANIINRNPDITPTQTMLTFIRDVEDYFDNRS
ncbi:MAG: DUF4435 domain-containing protein, partial [Pseudomonadota bacterium]